MAICPDCVLALASDKKPAVRPVCTHVQAEKRERCIRDTKTANTRGNPTVTQLFNPLVTTVLELLTSILLRCNHATMRRSFPARVPVEFKARLQEEETSLGLPSMLDTVGYILGHYFCGKQAPKGKTALAESETTSVTAISPQVAPPGATVKPSAATEREQDADTKGTRVLYGGRIHVA